MVGFLADCPTMSEAQMTRRPQDVDWAMSTIFFGNLSHEDLFIQCDKISHIVSAHSHQPNRGTLGNDIITITLGSDYRAPEYITIESKV